MGFNPDRKFVRRRADTYLVIGTLLVTIALLAWALLA